MKPLKKRVELPDVSAGGFLVPEDLSLDLTFNPDADWPKKTVKIVVPKGVRLFAGHFDKAAINQETGERE